MKTFRHCLLVLAVVVCVIALFACTGKTGDETVKETVSETTGATGDLLTADELLHANDLSVLMERYDNVLLTRRLNDGEGNLDSTFEYFLIKGEGGRLTLYINVTDASGETVANYVADNGIGYFLAEPDMMYLEILADADLNAALYERIPAQIAGQTVTGGPTAEDGYCILHTTEPGEGDGMPSYTYTYWFDAETGLAERAEYRGVGEDGSVLTGDVRFSYNVSGYTPNRSAYEAQVGSDDAVELTVITDGKTDGEQRRVYPVSPSSDFGVTASDGRQYSLFENVSCTREVECLCDVIDTHNAVVYVGEAKTEAIDFRYTYTPADSDEFTDLLEAFEALAMDPSQSLSDVDVAYDYLLDRYQYLEAQSAFAYRLYCTDTTDDVLWENYLTAEDARQTAFSQYWEMAERLYASDAPCKEEFFAGWTEEDLLKLSGGFDTDEVNRLNLLNKDIQRQSEQMPGNEKDRLRKQSELFVQLVANNQALANLYGYDNYYDYASAVIYGRTYTEEERAAFREYSKTYILPLYQQMTDRLWSEYYTLSEEQRNLLWMLNNGTAYDELDRDYLSGFLSSFTGSLNERMNAMFDKQAVLFVKGENGLGVAYTNYLAYYGEPYVVFGGEDPYYQGLFVVTHEMGHYTSMFDYTGQSLDLAETYSQSMEYLLLSYLNGQIDQDVYRILCLYRLMNDLQMVLISSVIDEFEETVYLSDTPYTAADCESLLAKLCDRYGLSDMTEAFSEYTLSVSIASPVYFISYGYSLIPSMSLFFTANEEYAAAQEMYRKLQEDLDSYTDYPAALALAGMSSPFDEQTFRNLLNAIDAYGQTGLSEDTNRKAA